MDLEECKRKGFIRNINPNIELVKSLIEMSKSKEEVVKTAEIDENNIFVYLPVAYDSLREILEGICVMKGYKVTSHVCIEKLLENLYPEISFKDFDRFRYIRNSINYYGKKVDLDSGKEIITKIFSFKKKLIREINKLIY